MRVFMLSRLQPLGELGPYVHLEYMWTEVLPLSVISLGFIQSVAQIFFLNEP